MEASNADNTGSEKTSSKLVPILVIIGIGIPVLVELLTLFNLINVQLFEDEKKDRPVTQSVTEVRGFGEGDTLFANYRSPVVIDEVKIEVSAQQWHFSFELTYPVGANESTPPQISVDSLELQSGKILQKGEFHSWEVEEGEAPEFKANWELPNGDIPLVIFMSSFQPVASDSVQKIQQEVTLDDIPVRYTRED